MSLFVKLLMIVY